MTFGFLSGMIVVRGRVARRLRCKHLLSVYPCVSDRSVAQVARAPVSKTGCRGFESLHSCHKQQGHATYSVLATTYGVPALYVAPTRLTLFLRFYFVSAKVFLGLDVERMLAQDRIILTQLQFLWAVLGILGRVIMAVSGLLAHQTNHFSFIAFFGHLKPNLYNLLPGIVTDYAQFSTPMASALAVGVFFDLIDPIGFDYHVFPQLFFVTAVLRIIDQGGVSSILMVF